MPKISKKCSSTSSNWSKSKCFAKCSVAVCRICLGDQAKLYHIKDKNLNADYEEIINSKISNSYSLPPFVCVLCATLLVKYITFKRRITRTLQLLNGILNDGKVINEESLESIDRFIEGLHPSYQKSHTVIHDSTVIENDDYMVGIKDETIEIKVEPPDMALKPDYADTLTGNDKIDKVDNENAKDVFQNDDINCVEELDNSNDDDESETEDFAADISEGESQEKSSRRKSKMENWEVTKYTHDEAVKVFEEGKESKIYKNAAFKCEMCYKGFTTQKTYDLHLQSRHDPSNSYECKYCHVRFAKYPGLVSHRLLHLSRYRCRLCGLVVNCRPRVKRHDLFHEGFTYRCKICGAVQETQSSYYSHMRTKHESETVCPVCGINLFSRRSLRLHVNAVHPKIQVEECGEGGEGRGESGGGGGGGDALWCGVCAVRFHSETAFQVHLLTSAKHSAADPLQPRLSEKLIKKYTKRKELAWVQQRSKKMNSTCPECGQVFTVERQYLEHHRAAHPHVPVPYRHMCDLCGKTYRSPSDMQEHRVTHTGERAFACSACDKAFYRKSQLVKHIQAVHEKQRGHQCVECGKAFSTSSGLRQHTTHVHHRVPWPRRHRTEPAPAEPYPLAAAH